MPRRKQTMAGIGALVLAIAAGTLFVLSTHVPEARTATSSDGRITVSGSAAPSVGNLHVSRTNQAVGAPSVTGKAYAVELGNRALPPGFSLVISYDDAPLNGTAPNHLAVFGFVLPEGKWTALPSVVDPAAHTISATTNGMNALWWTIGAQ